MKLKINPLQYITPYTGKRDSYLNVGHRAYISAYDNTQKIMLPDLNNTDYVFKYMGWFNIYPYNIKINTYAGDLIHYLHKSILKYYNKRNTTQRKNSVHKAVELFIYNMLYGLKNNKLGMFASCRHVLWKSVKVINSEKVNAYCSMNSYFECVDYFERMGYIIYVRGVKATSWTRSIGYTANFGKFLFTDKLRDLVHSYAPKYKLIKFKWHFDYTTTTMKQDGNDEKLANIDDNKDVIEYSQGLCKSYNSMIKKHDVYKCDSNNKRVVNIDTDIQRKFYRDDANNKGRYHMLGGSIQTWHKTDRPKICIDGSKTIEMDIKGTHLAILYSLKHLKMPSDPYKIPDQRRYFQCYKKVDNITIKKEMRKFIKKSLLIMINAENYKKSHEAICNILKDDYNSSIQDQEFEAIHKVRVKQLMQAIVNFHKPISAAFYSDAGIKLMGYESDVMGKVLEWCVHTDTPLLQVYDSFICKISDQHKVIDVIFSAWLDVFCSNNNLTLTY